MSGKLNRATWSNPGRRECCAVCLKQGKSLKDAKACSGEHYHKFCGGRIEATAAGLQCKRDSDHRGAVLLKFVALTLDEAVRDGIKW